MTQGAGRYFAAVRRLGIGSECLSHPDRLLTRLDQVKKKPQGKLHADDVKLLTAYAAAPPPEVVDYFLAFHGHLPLPSEGTPTAPLPPRPDPFSSGVATTVRLALRALPPSEGALPPRLHGGRGNGLETALSVEAWRGLKPAIAPEQPVNGVSKEALRQFTREVVRLAELDLGLTTLDKEQVHVLCKPRVELLQRARGELSAAFGVDLDAIAGGRLRLPGQIEGGVFMPISGLIGVDLDVALRMDGAQLRELIYRQAVHKLQLAHPDWREALMSSYQALSHAAQADPRLETPDAITSLDRSTALGLAMDAHAEFMQRHGSGAVAIPEATGGAMETLYRRDPECVAALFRHPVLGELLFRSEGPPVEVPVRDAATPQQVDGLVELIHQYRSARPGLDAVLLQGERSTAVRGS